MDKKAQDLLKSVLEKRRNCIPLTNEEQKFVDDTYGQLFEKKFGNRTFTVSTGDEIRKSASKSVQPDAAISKERSPFKTKDSKIENDDSSGAVKEVEEGDMVNVDEKDGDKSSEQTNASDIVNADNEEEQRKPVFKFGDVVVKAVKGNLYAGVILKYYEKQDAVMVKWANGTFSNEYSSALRLAKDALKEEDEKVSPPIVKPAEKTEVKTPGTDKADVTKADDVTEEEKPTHEEAEEKPAEEVAETPEQQAQEQAEGTEEHAEPTEQELADNEWKAKCVKAVGDNSDVENAEGMCAYVHKSMKKSGDKIVKMTVQEIRETGNNKLADSMDKAGRKELNFDSSDHSIKE